MDCSLPGSSVHGEFPGENTGVGCHALLQGIFPTQGLNTSLPQLLHCRQIPYPWATREVLIGYTPKQNKKIKKKKRHVNRYVQKKKKTVFIYGIEGIMKDY